MLVEMRLSKIIISEINDNQVVFLKELDGERQLPILIGIFEATSIDRRVKMIPRPRPLTHDLLGGVIEALGGQLKKILITELNDATYYAQLQIEQNGKIVNIDSRPSDAIAIAVTEDPPVPIFVEEEVINTAMQNK